MELNSPFALIASRAEGSGSVLNGGALETVSELLCEGRGLLQSCNTCLCFIISSVI